MKLTTAPEQGRPVELIGMCRFIWPDTLGSEQAGRPYGPDAMTVEESTADGAYVLRAQLHEFHPDDVEIDITDHTLRIRAERRNVTTKVSGDRSYRSEIRCCAYSRTFPLPPAATDRGGRATYRDGIVEVRVPLGDATTPAVAA